MIDSASAHWLPLAATGATAVWLTLGCVLLVWRSGHRRRSRRVVATLDVIGAGAPEHVEDETRQTLVRALRSDDVDVRRAAVQRLGQLGASQDWAIDGLLLALTEGADTPARIATWLARLVPRPGRRLVPLLGHPDEAVRFWAVRLVGGYDDLVRDHVVAMAQDPSPRVRAAALSTLRPSSGPDALRHAVEFLSDPAPPVRAHACRAVAAIGGAQLADLIVPLLSDPSWWVREAAADALRKLGPAVVGFIASGLSSADTDVGRGVAIVLQDLGVVDSLVQSGHDPKLLGRVYAAGGEQLARAAEQRAAAGASLRTGRVEDAVPEAAVRWA